MFLVRFFFPVGVRPQMPENKCAMHWYCYFLQLRTLPSLDCTGDGTARREGALVE